MVKIPTGSPAAAAAEKEEQEATESKEAKAAKEAQEEAQNARAALAARVLHPERMPEDDERPVLAFHSFPSAGAPPPAPARADGADRWASGLFAPHADSAGAGREGCDEDAGSASNSNERFRSSINPQFANPDRVAALATVRHARDNSRVMYASTHSSDEPAEARPLGFHGTWPAPSGPPPNTSPPLLLTHQSPPLAPLTYNHRGRPAVLFVHGASHLRAARADTAQLQSAKVSAGRPSETSNPALSDGHGGRRRRRPH